MAEYGAKGIAVGCYLLFLLLTKVLNDVKAEIPLNNAKETVEEMIRKLAEWMRGQTLPTMQFPDIPYPVTPSFLLQGNPLPKNNKSYLILKNSNSSKYAIRCFKITNEIT